MVIQNFLHTHYIYSAFRIIAIQLMDHSAPKLRGVGLESVLFDMLRSIYDSNQ